MMASLAAAVGLVGALVTAFISSRVVAAEPANPDWPCTQRKVATLTSAQIWDGPPVDDLTQWRDNTEIEMLVPVLASRRVPLEEAAAAIARFAEAQPQDQRDEALKLLFAGVLSTINSERAIVMRGIERFQRRQRARAAEIERQGATIRHLKSKAASDEKARAELAQAEEKYKWEVRIFSERQGSLPLACEVPTMLEQRVFELGREIRSRMSD
jgi:hypothetical protein